jgi:hypothetical protein
VIEYVRRQGKALSELVTAGFLSTISTVYTLWKGGTKSLGMNLG